MPLGQVRVDPGAFPPEEMTCLRCGTPAPMRFAGACPSCTETLRATMRGEVTAVDAQYVPKTNVTPNAVALRE
jgi:hypothetical protein